MADQQLLKSLISDLRKMRDACNRRDEPGVDLAAAHRYLVRNYDLIHFFVKQVYTKLSPAQRSELQNDHHELDYVAVKENWYDLAMQAPNWATKTKEWEPELLQRHFVEEDAVNCLLRALEFAKYCPLDPNSHQLSMSPIGEYGLQLYGAQAYNLTDEEEKELNIPWHISDILYSDRKSKAMAECMNLGVDLEHSLVILPFAVKDFESSVERNLEKSREIIIQLLNDRLGFDLALVYINSPKFVIKCTNDILDRWSPEYGEFYRAFSSLQIKGEYSKKPFEEYKKAIWNKILYIRPKPETYDLVQEMIGNHPITEVIMGDKITIGNIGGSAIININSTLKDVTQTINSSKNLDQDSKKRLAELIEQLKSELENAPATKAEEAETIAEYAKNLVEASVKEQPNKSTLKITAEGLKKAAEDIAGVMPSVLVIASGIVKFAFQLAGVPLP